MTFSILCIFPLGFWPAAGFLVPGPFPVTVPLGSGRSPWFRAVSLVPVDSSSVPWLGMFFRVRSSPSSSSFRHRSVFCAFFPLGFRPAAGFPVPGLFPVTVPLGSWRSPWFPWMPLRFLGLGCFLDDEDPLMCDDVTSDNEWLIDDETDLSLSDLQLEDLSVDVLRGESDQVGTSTSTTPHISSSSGAQQPNKGGFFDSFVFFLPVRLGSLPVRLNSFGAPPFLSGRIGILAPHGSAQDAHHESFGVVLRVHHRRCFFGSAPSWLFNKSFNDFSLLSDWKVRRFFDSFISYVAVRLGSLDDLPFLSDRDARHVLHGSASPAASGSLGVVLRFRQPVGFFVSTLDEAVTTGFSNRKRRTDLDPADFFVSTVDEASGSFSVRLRQDHFPQAVFLGHDLSRSIGSKGTGARSCGISASSRLLFLSDFSFSAPLI
ncbi:hypothetical protein MA16_Dca008215 [Dendrobium catenatum]|uniref:Uncharacterized protein n=1 Tax=Dendrobium catenatum TaxID=906689 RepID=A0A2I0X6H2_9ASPA|nr:hypothetical protein MA16_Dca008215 [Dendrobium catenatum]